jgi:exodeoxyribonuclease VII large subunit
MQILESSTAKVFTVSQLNQAAKQLLNQHFLKLQVEGEISNLSTPSSGHIYFTLKDDRAQIRCALFKSNQRRLKFTPENGQQVLAIAQVSLYEARGDYQLLVESLKEKGDGELQHAFEALKQKLLQQGLFAADHKQTLPKIPSCIAVITSPTGAALRDILTVLKRRFPAIPVIVYPASVQGEQAKFEIVNAIETVNQHNECNVILLSRGGGSQEDLWSFNEEIVARAIYASQIPIITGIGHETDTTIADFVADLRAATPSVAAEHLTPDYQIWLQRFQAIDNRLQQLLKSRLLQTEKQLEWLSKSLQQQRPDQKLQQKSQLLDELEIRMQRSVQLKLAQANNTVTEHTSQLWLYHPENKINAYKNQQHFLASRLDTAMQRKLEQQQQYLSGITQTLDAVSPLATLNRGYAIVSMQTNQKIITASSQLKPGDKINTRLAKGNVTSQVEAIYEN